MNIRHMTGLVLLASFAGAPTLSAQVPVAPVPAPVLAPAPTKNIFTFLFPSQDQCARVRACICNSSVGLMLQSAAKPLSLATGGLCFSKCSIPTAEDLRRLAEAGREGSAEGVAAAIKRSEYEAQARREAVRYLGTVDCNRYPEAKDALIASLLGDPNECVRLEAALALGRGCCCNKDNMEALKQSANGVKGKGFPAETCDRVRWAAADALARCVADFVELAPVDERIKEKEGPGKEFPEGRPIIYRSSLRGQGLFGVVTAGLNAPKTPLQEPIRQLQTAEPIHWTAANPAISQPGASMPASGVVAAPIVTKGWITIEEERGPSLPATDGQIIPAGHVQNQTPVLLPPGTPNNR